MRVQRLVCYSKLIALMSYSAIHLSVYLARDLVMWLLWYSVICFFSYLTICYSAFWLLSYSAIRLVRKMTISQFSYSPIRLLVTFWLKLVVLGFIYGDLLDPAAKNKESLRIDRHLDMWGVEMGKPRGDW